ncbi:MULTISPECIES: hypothetical protein [unclassified Pseudomonas]|uniref:hypothetical protein n=1 Tax=unclassified Pseudomonas TaxID=196821 RepID=UPI002448A2EA|nr:MULTISPECIES: hypothetical protein [unclassified Pseudomonas]MDG9926340.1 hypothetical protein [Pseudomonas sp. GD04045]MDH0037589.1 hypothetical protein [Pseudomonas sp. GD04019]
MRYHDYHLKKYEVSDRGETIAFHLVYGYPEEETDDSYIKFSNVALYNFSHTMGAIITDIEEIEISELMQEYGNEITEWNRMHGVRFWKDNLQNYSRWLQSEGYKAWRIVSAIGFYGFVIAKTVDNA